MSLWRRPSEPRAALPGLLIVPSLLLTAAVAAWVLAPLVERSRAPPAPELAGEPQPASSGPAASIAVAATEPAPVAVQERPPSAAMKVLRQSWRRGGLGSRALVTFTLQNGNAFPVGRIALTCSFSRRDGSHLTSRTRVLPDSLPARGRKRYAQLHVGYVNVHAERVRCSVASASRMS